METLLTPQLQRLVVVIVLLFFIFILHAGCTPQATDPAATPPPAPATPAPGPPPSATIPAAQPAITPTPTQPVTHTAVLLPTASPPTNATNEEGALLSLRDIPRYPAMQPIPPDKNPVLATMIEEIRRQAGDESEVEAEAFTLVGVDDLAPVPDIELFYTTELADWQHLAEPRYDVAVPANGTGQAIAMNMSWGKHNQIFTVVVVEMYGQYFLLTLLQSDA